MFSSPTSRASILLLPLLSLILPSVNAKSGWGEACSQNNTHLDQETWAIVTDCDVTTYCNINGTCAYRGCRSDIYPVGYNGVPFDQLPPLCPDGKFCPDEGDKCMDQSPVDGPCQKDRDDECAPPPNWRDLDGFLNVNGSICLNFQCYWANVTLGQTCINDNTPYTGFNDRGGAYAFVVSRDNCANGLYCDGTALQCLKAKPQGDACTGNKECLSYHCQSNMICGRRADEPLQAAPWQYVLVGIGILALITGTFVGLWFLHRRWRTEYQIKLEQYYNEQIAFRQSIMSMSHAKNSLMALPNNTSTAEARRSLYMDDYNADQYGVLPPNMRRGDSSAWSDNDSEILLVSDDHTGPSKRDTLSPPLDGVGESSGYRGGRF